MSETLPTLQSGDDDLTRPDTPVAPKPPSPAMTRYDPVDPLTVAQPSDFSPEPHDTLSDDLILPVTTQLPSIPQASFVLSDVIGDAAGADFATSELAAAEITMAFDGSFVETPSGPAARELKRYWDQQLGVGKSVRSPYAITAFVNQHGKQMFRVGRRELSAPAANAAAIEERVTHSSSTPSEPSNSPHAKRRSRMSMHAFPSMFKNGSISSGSRTAIQAAVPRKLRKTRSIPDLVSSTNDPSSPAVAAGRGHSRSVTGADVSPFSTVVRNPNTGDLFGEVMDWQPPPASETSISTPSLASTSNEIHDHFKTPTIIAYPFGHGVSYDSPSRKSNTAVPLLHAPLPRLLREVQSFESGLTARQVDLPKRSGKESSLAMESYFDEFDTGRPPSALRIHALPFTPEHDVTPTSATPDPTPSLDPEPTLLSRYSTDVFDVLQTYSGIPLLEKLSSDLEETTVIKLSSSADESAAPRDDPRFVIWGEIQPERDHDDHASVSHESVTDLSVHSSSLSGKRRASRAKAPPLPPPSTSSHNSAGEPQKVLIAATIERWIGQLTSDLNYDELLDFFLTYRTYVSSVDLCHLLIARFHWALQSSSSARDERVRRIVRVRTFVAMRYWLLTFFTVDFLPNRELRLLVADWLNTLIKDPILKTHSDGLVRHPSLLLSSMCSSIFQGIVRKLIKVTKECKQAHIRSPATAKSSKPRSSLGSTLSSKPPAAKKAHVLGEKFAAATRKPSVEDDDSDLDLDFLPDEGAPPPESPHDVAVANAHLSAAHVGAGGLSPGARPGTFPVVQPVNQAPVTSAEAESYAQAPPPIPIHHSALSRAFVKTIGRLGRWKRVLNSNSRNATTRASIGVGADVSAFDLEMPGATNLLPGGGAGVERAVGPPPITVEVPVPEPVSVPVELHVLAPTPVAEIANVPSEHGKSAERLPLEVDEVTPPPPSSSEPANASQGPLDSPPDYVLPETKSIPQASTPASSTSGHTADVEQDDDTAVSIRSTTSTDSFGEVLTTGPTFPALARSQWQQFDIVSIDDLDLSDTSSEHHEPGLAAPPGLRRLPRKLPLRRDFEFLRRSDTVSSMGLTSRDSATSNSSSHASSASAIALGAGVAQWQLNALKFSLSDDEENGDVEDALRRLEGQINPKKQQEKASKVDGWVRTIQERMAAGDYSDEAPLFSDDEDESDEEEYESGEQSSNQSSDAFDHDSASVRQAPSISELEGTGEDPEDGGMDHLVKTPVPTQLAHVVPAPSSGPGSPTRSTDAKPAPEDVVPIEILQSRMPSNARPSTSSLNPSISRNPEAPRVHRSFILNHRAVDLAEHFAMIDRELFMGVKFEELVLDDWMNCKEVDVLDWAQYLKDRARWKVEHRYPDKTSALGAVRARFNLMANFTISEVVLTQPQERPMLVAKLIRVAWASFSVSCLLESMLISMQKSYLMCNFSTLVAIIAGLGSTWVTNAMRRHGWNRVGIWENRMFKDLKVFTTNVDDFKYIRQTVASISDAKPLDTAHAASVVSGGGTDTQSGKAKTGAERPVVPAACVPFVGVYLSQLQRHSRLPDLIDPTAPDENVGINPVTGNFDAPAHPEVFSALAPLPSSINLEPLINVHKQRRIAGVIKSLVAGQHLASRVHFDVDKKLFQRCLRLRGVNADALQRVLSLYPE
ncbi:hypothetical protein DXG03_002306 [Asterophora parasitica]|uniref:Uncharacterized protein n=1 Tax=Asterophora parasitica TaxID=117018 RepID=A0A9P7K9W5_9AGAR|nr:hypothetical protein DXG03_002306 [Asterophora parasitica]